MTENLKNKYVTNLLAGESRFSVVYSNGLSIEEALLGGTSDVKPLVWDLLA